MSTCNVYYVNSRTRRDARIADKSNGIMLSCAALSVSAGTHLPQANQRRTVESESLRPSHWQIRESRLALPLTASAPAELIDWVPVEVNTVVPPAAAAMARPKATAVIFMKALPRAVATPSSPGPWSTNK